MNRSYLTGCLVKSGPTKVGFVRTRFQLFLAVFLPVLTTLNISCSLIPRTFGNGTENRADFSFRLFLIADESAFALVGFERSRRKAGMGFDGSASAWDLTFRSSWAFIFLRICTFSFRLSFWSIFARRPRAFCAS